VEILVVLGFRSLFVSAGVFIPFVLHFFSSLSFVHVVLVFVVVVFPPPPFSLVEVCVYEALLMFLARFFLWLTGCCEVQSIVCFCLPIDFGPRSRSPVHLEEGVRRCRVIAESWRSIWLRYLVPKRIGWTVLSTSRLVRADMVIDVLACTTDPLSVPLCCSPTCIRGLTWLFPELILMHKTWTHANCRSILRLPLFSFTILASSWSQLWSTEVNKKVHHFFFFSFSMTVRMVGFLWIYFAHCFL
jgi:hypothetical protein